MSGHSHTPLSDEKEKTDIMRQAKVFFSVPFCVGFYSYENLSFFIVKPFTRQACYMIKGKDVICTISEATCLSFRKGSFFKTLKQDDLE